MTDIPSIRPTLAGDTRSVIEDGGTALGIELGSSRIKAVLIGPDHAVVATGSHAWENQMVGGLWTYALDDVWSGLQACYRQLGEEVRQRYGVELATIGALGISGMMHGYLAFDADGRVLVPFRTWRNTNTGAAADRLSAEMKHNVPHRWSAAHLYQAILDEEDHVAEVGFLTTLAGYVHWQLTGQKVVGIGDASGMFPIDTAVRDYDVSMLDTFDRLAAEAGHTLRIARLLPRVQVAGEDAGRLTQAGARLIDPSGVLQPGVAMCPPEGDAGTGMVATCSVAPRTGNVSVGTSIFAMIVLDRALTGQHRELDLVTTPAGDPVAMVHCNNGASELDAWVKLFTQFAGLLGTQPDPATVFATLLSAAVDGTPDCGGMLAYNYLAGEPITGLDAGRPLFLRTPDSDFDLATFIRTHLFAAFATLRIGMDVLQKNENIRLDQLFAHGGLFTTRGVPQRFLAAAVNTPVTIGDTASQGGAWGIAVLAAYLRSRTPDQTLTDYLTARIFTGLDFTTVKPDPGDVDGFDRFMQRYTSGLAVQRAAIENS